MIEIENISKRFGSKQVLKGVTSRFETGKTNLIIGQSGSGKTILMKILVGLIDSDTGVVSYDGRNFLEMSSSDQMTIRKEIGMVFQGGALFDSMTVEENIMFPLKMFQDEPYHAMLDRVNFCLNRVNLEYSNDLYPTELSGGMKKRVAIARAIASNPRYLFCDEPNSGLDPKTSIVIDSLIQDITKEFNITTIVNTHDMNSVMGIGDKISFIYEGNLWWEGSKENVLHTDNVELNDFVFCSELTQRLRPDFKR